MELVTTLLIALGLSMDSFAVSLGVGAAGKANTPRPILRLSFHMGLFQGAMTLLGWLVGFRIASLISGFDHWIALAFLAFVGVRMVRSGLDPRPEVHSGDATRGWLMMTVCIATSIDALAVGLSLAMLKVDILDASLVVGVITLILSLAGLLAGGQLGLRFGKRMEILGGLILNGIGLRILLTHLL